MVQLPLGSFWFFFSRPVYVLQNCVARTSPPGVGEQQVFLIGAVFSQEKMRSSEAQERRLGKESVTELSAPRPPTTANAKRGSRRIADKRPISTVLLASLEVQEDQPVDLSRSLLMYYGDHASAHQMRP